MKMVKSMYKSSRQEFEYNNISYKNDVIITISQHIMRTLALLEQFVQVFSSTFRDIQQYSAISRHIEGHQGILRHIQALLRHIEL